MNWHMMRFHSSSSNHHAGVAGVIAQRFKPYTDAQAFTPFDWLGFCQFGPHEGQEVLRILNRLSGR